jgi:uncharacterized membrane protein YhaH (DUF805 family)
MADTTDTPPPSRGVLHNLFRLWFNFDVRVGRSAYLLTGVSLMLLEYAIQATLVYAAMHVLWSPLAFLSPIYSVRTAGLDVGKSWLFVSLAAVTLPFMWIGVSMSVRRAVDAGLSAWTGLLFIVPLLNYLMMLALAVLPSQPGVQWQPSPQPSAPYRRGGTQPEIPLQIDSGIKSALFGVVAAVAVGLAMVGISVYGLGAYGAALFFITPFVMGAVSGYLYNRPVARSMGRTLFVAFISTLVAGSALMLFALEGLVCLLMASPIAAVIALFGAVIGRVVAVQTATSLRHTAAMLVVLPGLAGAEAALPEAPLHEVVSVIEINAPPEEVWPNVIGFSELDPPSEAIFRSGVAYPMRARIDGEGVGAVRHCEFSTGAFVEPITIWDPPRRLSFDVASQPPPMKEWSPFANIHPPHLDGSLRSKRGEFRLIRLDDGRTRLEGSTWYEISMAPSAYWQAWSDLMIHAIHTRVLRHIQSLSERDRHSRSTRGASP